jgi:hypothetical protein
VTPLGDNSLDAATLGAEGASTLLVKTRALEESVLPLLHFGRRVVVATDLFVMMFAAHNKCKARFYIVERLSLVA